MPGSVERIRQQREQERERKREEQRRARLLQRRAEQERERQRESERRAQAAREVIERDTAQEAARQRRRTLIERLRAERRQTERERVRRMQLFALIRLRGDEEEREDRHRPEAGRRRRELLKARRVEAETRPQNERARPPEPATHLRERGARRPEPETRPEPKRAMRPEPQRTRPSTEPVVRRRPMVAPAREPRREEKPARDQRRREALQARLDTQRRARHKAQRPHRRTEPVVEVKPVVAPLSSLRREDQSARRQLRRQATLARLITRRRARPRAEPRREPPPAATPPRPSLPRPALPERAVKPTETTLEARVAPPEEQRPLQQRQAEGQRKRLRRKEHRAALLDQAHRQRRLETRRHELAAARAPVAQRLRRAPKRPELEPAPPRVALADRIPSGFLSGSLPWLRVTGSRLTNLEGTPILLRGVSLLGLHRAPSEPAEEAPTGVGVDDSAIDAILDWGANIIRVSIHRERLLHATAGLRELDPIIRRAAAGGAYTMLSVGPRHQSTGALPGDSIASRLWSVLGEYYAAEPAVLFHLTNPGSAATSSEGERWRTRVRLIVAELRRVHPAALCFVSGLDDGADISGFPVTGTGGAPIPNLVYTLRLFPALGGLSPALRSLARRHPVFVAEWGGGPTDLGWGTRIAQLLRAEAIGWTAAHWNAEPRLAVARCGRIEPTLFGALIRHALAISGERLDVRLPVLPAAWNGDAMRIFE